MLQKTSKGLGLFVIHQLIDNNIVTPEALIYKKTVAISESATIKYFCLSKSSLLGVGVNFPLL
ncbi:MAG: hypothetical protein Q4B71_07885, partial [Cardiobacteriaceae bacterium]|nr:hypothetical protein [Cardiobacteriaceae bacterium]